VSITAASPLLAPLRFRNGVTAKNRIWLAPMTNLQSHADGTLSDDELSWLMRRAEGGFGVIETCAAHVAMDGKAWEGELGIFDDRLLPGLGRLASALEGAGTLGLVQLFHGGRRADPKLNGGRTWSASATAEDGTEAPAEGTAAEIEAVIGHFRDAAVRAERAGFPGVELHGAHGYLLAQFLSTTQNQRTDTWGGSFENRARLLRETMRAVRRATSPSFLVGVRLSPEDFGQSKGIDLDETLQLATWLCDDGADFIHASLWKALRNTTKRPAAHPIPLFRAAIPREVPLVVAGAIWTRAEGESLLAMGADAIALGRSAIANPEWPLRITDEGWSPKLAPLTVPELVERGLSPAFAGYLRAFRGMVAE
jgi:2,4-dienoyl-CoA reductase-like NADH-dependent reductase (Old Yellow Enzyme family)